MSSPRRPCFSRTRRAGAAILFLSLLPLPALADAGAPASGALRAAEDRYARFRRTNDPTDLAAAEAIVAKGLAAEPKSFDLRKFRLRLLLPHHRFEELAVEAAALKAERPDDPELDGALGDAFFDLGRYAESFAAYDRFVAAKPCTASYTRIALAREITGDLSGALAAMDLAAGAALPEDLEAFAWCRSRAARLLLKLNRYEEAEGRLVEALLRLQNHAPSLAVAAEVAARRGLFEAAVRLAERSISIFPDFSVAAALVDYREATGDAEGVARVTATVRTLAALLPEAERRLHRPLALFEAEHGDAGRAVEMTEAELAMRKDVWGWDAYAWALCRAGRAGEAVEPMSKALAVGTVDPLLEFHAGVIAFEAGDRVGAQKRLCRALELDPVFHIRWAKEARSLLDALEGHGEANRYGKDSSSD
jgi:tetratricopeptide (TPR) repeat protein